MSSFIAPGCGGAEKKRETTASNESRAHDGDYEDDDDDGLIPEEKFEEINRTFERKATLIARCFPQAVEAGEVDKNERIKLTVGVVIQSDGSPSNIKILATTKYSKAIESCVVKTVSRWQFTTLPRSLQYSYGFVLQRF